MRREGRRVAALERWRGIYGSRWITSSLTFPDEGRDVVTREPRARRVQKLVRARVGYGRLLRGVG